MPHVPRLSLAGADIPLLGGDTPPQTPTRAAARRPRRLWLRRWVRPLLIVLIPVLLVVGYAYLNPHFSYLPPLPKVTIEHGSKTAASVEDIAHYDPSDPDEPGKYFTPALCLCGKTPVGQQLCDVYHQQGLQASRLVQSSGARARRLLTKAQEGQPIKIGVLGGSGECCGLR
jgi:hypothetical protein